MCASLEKEIISVKVNGVDLRVASMHKDGHLPPIVFLHGFGSTKEDYADAATFPQLAGRRIIAFDAPGCGETECNDLSELSIPFLLETAQQVLRHYGVEKFHLVDLSDNADLFEKFTGLPCAKMFVYGDQNRSLSYLETLMKRGVQLAEIAHSGHWPMYANPPALWARLNQFITLSERGLPHE